MTANGSKVIKIAPLEWNLSEGINNNHAQVWGNNVLVDNTTKVWLTSISGTEKHIDSNLTLNIGATVTFNVSNCNIASISYTSNTKTYTKDYNTAEWSCSNNQVTLNITGIEPATGSNEIVITYTTPTPTGSGSDGGASVSKAYDITFTKRGTEKELKQDESARIVFGGAYHKIKVIKVGKDYADINVFSDTISFRLYIRESKKINLNADNYYDLYIELKEIVGSKAKLIIKKMKEEILPTVPAVASDVAEEVPKEIPEKVVKKAEIEVARKEEVEKLAPSRLSRIKGKLLIKNMLRNVPSKVYVFALIVVAVSSLIIFSLKAIESRKIPDDITYIDSVLYNYMKRALKKGFDKKMITETAIRGGWKKKTVDRMFKKIRQK